MSGPQAGKGDTIGTAFFQKVLSSPATWGLVIGLLCIALGVFALLRFGTLLARTGGWEQLAESYRATAPLEGTLHHRESLKLGSVTRYRGCVDIVVGPGGLGLRALWPLHGTHPDLLIPWDDLEPVQSSGGARMLRVGRSQVVLTVVNPRILEEARARRYLASAP
jgi:hypothetical protein